VRSFLLLAIAVCLPLFGCGGESLPTTYLVTGVVTHQGKPVQEAAVTLVPTNEKGRSASGLTDADGKFSVKTYIDPANSPDGALPGDYIVTVSKFTQPKIPDGLTPWEEQAWFTKNPAKSLLPKLYLSPSTSPVKMTVEKADPEPLTIELKD
jgi:hypothetical protein